MGALLFAWRIRQITAAPACWGDRRKNGSGLQTNRAVSGAIRFRLFGMADQENRMNGRRSDGDRLENNKRKQRKGDIS